MLRTRPVNTVRMRDDPTSVIGWYCQQLLVTCLAKHWNKNIDYAYSLDGATNENVVQSGLINFGRPCIKSSRFVTYHCWLSKER